MTSNNPLLDPRLQSPQKPPPPTLGALNDEVESEWEYEYSATETETFYVTLDLSKADFRAQEQLKSHTFTPRGPWPASKASEVFLNKRKAAAEASQNSAASSTASSDAERDEEDEVDNEQPDTSREGQSQHKNKRRRLSAPEDDDGGDSRELERVQILDLHSTKPLISYKGRVFCGAWSENTTTELLITPRYDTGSLPVLRHLDDHVDLLAASSARINVTEKKLRPQYSDRERQRASANLPQTVIPPVDHKAPKERIDQRNFLADLIALKRRKGEPDDVTVIAQSMQGKRAKEKAKGTRTHRRGRWSNSKRLQHARGTDEKLRRGGRKKGSGRGRGKWVFFSLEEMARDSASVASSAPEGELGGSTPTPFHWDDLEEGQDDSTARLEDLMEVDVDDEQDEDEAGSDDNNDYEEDEEDDQGDIDEEED